LKTRTIKLEPCDYENAGVGGRNCPVARAIRRTLKKPPEIVVCIWTDHVQIGDNVYRLPDEANMADVAWTKSREKRLIEFQLSNEKINT
jgi:hypothetical protein